MIEDPKTPLDALDVAVSWSLLSSRPHKPGVVVQHLPENVRSLLKNLTSDDSLKLRPRFLK